MSSQNNLIRINAPHLSKDNGRLFYTTFRNDTVKRLWTVPTVPSLNMERKNTEIYGNRCILYEFIQFFFYFLHFFDFRIINQPTTANYFFHAAQCSKTIQRIFLCNDHIRNFSCL